MRDTDIAKLQAEADHKRLLAVEGFCILFHISPDGRKYVENIVNAIIEASALMTLVMRQKAIDEMPEFVSPYSRLQKKVKKQK